MTQAVNAVLSGRNGLVLAYGPTGTGKTHTIFGGPDFWNFCNETGAVNEAELSEAICNRQNPCLSPYEKQSKRKQLMSKRIQRAAPEAGVVPRAIEAVFEHIRHGKDLRLQFRLSLSIVQIYLDQVTDLLASDKTPTNLKIRKGPSSTGSSNAGATGSAPGNWGGTYVENLSWRYLSNSVLTLIRALHAHNALSPARHTAE